jgi:hypothetical protein
MRQPKPMRSFCAGLLPSPNSWRFLNGAEQPAPWTLSQGDDDSTVDQELIQCVEQGESGKHPPRWNRGREGAMAEWDGYREQVFACV